MKYLIHALALLACTSAYSGKLLLTWDANPTMEEVFGYVVYEKTTDGPFIRLGKVGLTRAALVDVPAGHHCYVITAANEHGESKFSKEVCTDVFTGPLVGDTRLEREPPSAQIVSLPEFTPNTFTVQWSGEDDPGGVGVDFYDVFVSVNDGTFEPWLQGTKLTQKDYSGIPGNEYMFYVVAVDIGGNRSIPNLASQSQTRVPQGNRPPVIHSSNRGSARAGQAFQMTIQALDFETPPGNLRYSLCEDNGSASLDPVTGMFHWYVDPAQTMQTNRFVVCVTDGGDPAQTTSQVLEVVVDNFMTVQLGSVVVGAGAMVEVPLQVYSSVPGWYLSMELETPGGKVKQVVFQADQRQVCMDAYGRVKNDVWEWMGLSCMEGPLARRGNMGSFGLQVTEIKSQVIPVNIKNVTALTFTGEPITDVRFTSGKVIMLGEEPVLDMVREPGQQSMSVYLYGIPGFYYSLDWTTDPKLTSDWGSGWEGMLEKNYKRFEIPSDFIPSAFFRAREITTPLMLPMPANP